MLDESMASEDLIRLGLAQTDLLVESRVYSKAFAFFPRNKWGFSTGRDLKKIWNVFFLFFDAYNFFLFPEQNLVNPKGERGVFPVTAGRRVQAQGAYLVARPR